MCDKPSYTVISTLQLQVSKTVSTGRREARCCSIAGNGIYLRFHRVCSYCQRLHIYALLIIIYSVF